MSHDFETLDSGLFLQDLRTSSHLEFVYIGTKVKAASLPDGFIENPILCSHRQRSKTTISYWLQ